MLIINKKEPAGTAIIACTGGNMVLVPGLNVVPTEKWPSLEKTLQGVDYLVPIKITKNVKSKGKDGKEVETEVETVADFADIPAKSTSEVIASIMSLDQLAKIYETETRDSVRTELQRRRAAIEKQLGL